MKKILLFSIFCVVSVFKAQSQNTSVEKSIFNIQTGFLGVWINNEAKINNKITLRSEIGLDSGFDFEFVNRDLHLVFSPVLTIEPRYYYNLDKRKNQGKRIDNNSGNYLSLKSSFYSDVFNIKVSEEKNIAENISFIPTWGIRRNLGDHFNFETGIGLGVVYYFEKQVTLLDSYHASLAANIHLRIGYSF